MLHGVKAQNTFDQNFCFPPPPLIYIQLAYKLVSIDIHNFLS